MNSVLQACIERVNLLQREDLNIFDRHKLAIEFKEFVDKYVNPEYRDNFYMFINHILQKYRIPDQNKQPEPHESYNEPREPDSSVMWPPNCTHIKIAYYIWNQKKSSFSNPLEIAQMYRRYYYEEAGYNESERGRGTIEGNKGQAGNGHYNTEEDCDRGYGQSFGDKFVGGKDKGGDEGVGDSGVARNSRFEC